MANSFINGRFEGMGEAATKAEIKEELCKALEEALFDPFELMMDDLFTRVNNKYGTMQGSKDVDYGQGQFEMIFKKELDILLRKMQVLRKNCKELQEMAEWPKTDSVLSPAEIYSKYEATTLQAIVDACIHDRNAKPSVKIGTAVAAITDIVEGRKPTRNELDDLVDADGVAWPLYRMFDDPVGSGVMTQEEYDALFRQAKPFLPGEDDAEQEEALQAHIAASRANYALYRREHHKIPVVPRIEHFGLILGPIDQFLKESARKSTIERYLETVLTLQFIPAMETIWTRQIETGFALGIANVPNFWYVYI